MRAYDVYVQFFDTDPLKPCPFCGGPAKTNFGGNPKRLWRVGCAADPEFCLGRWVRYTSHGWTTEAEAIAAWNFRAQPARRA
jgi:hypothetical protein